MQAFLDIFFPRRRSGTVLSEKWHRRKRSVLGTEKKPGLVDDESDSETLVEDTSSYLVKASSDEQRPLKVIIIGAGLSGIVAAIK